MNCFKVLDHLFNKGLSEREVNFIITMAIAMISAIFLFFLGLVLLGIYFYSKSGKST
jgi:hypothetical protein